MSGRTSSAAAAPQASTRGSSHTTPAQPFCTSEPPPQMNTDVSERSNTIVRSTDSAPQYRFTIIPASTIDTAAKPLRQVIAMVASIASAAPVSATVKRMSATSAGATTAAIVSAR